MRTASLALALFFALAPAAQNPGRGWDVISPGSSPQLPRDWAPHPSFQTEWWYATGFVSDAAGHRYGIQWTLFRHAIDASEPAPGESALRARQVLSGHLAVADLKARAFRFGQRVRRAAAGLAGWDLRGPEVWLEDWSLEVQDRVKIRIQASAAESGLALDLLLEPSAPAILQGDGGYSQKGAEPGNASEYFSFPRCTASGTLELDGKPLAVSGTLWFDREWGTTRLGEGVAGWDWFGLRLSDGRDLTLYRLRKSDGSASPFSSGTLAAPQGGTRRLGSGDFSLDPSAYWTSPKSGARYPVRWRLRVPSCGLDLEARAPLEGCEVDDIKTTGTLYWEGPVGVSGSAKGEGYMELTGYGGAIAGWF